MNINDEAKAVYILSIGGKLDHFPADEIFPFDRYRVMWNHESIWFGLETMLRLMAAVERQR